MKFLTFGTYGVTSERPNNLLHKIKAHKVLKKSLLTTFLNLNYKISGIGSTIFI